MIVGPHTSNWDFIIGIMARSALGTKIHFLGKHQLFIAPWGWIFRAMDRGRRHWWSHENGEQSNVQQDCTGTGALASSHGAPYDYEVSSGLR